jgi:hypothetical protein
MSKRSFPLIAAFGLLACLAVGTPCQAASVTYYSAVVPNQDVPFSAIVSLPLFNPALGTLTGVTLSVDATTVGHLLVFNTSGSTLSFTNGFTSVPVTVTSSIGGTSVTTTATATLASGTAAPGINTYPGLTGTITGLQPVLTGIGSYVGAGTFNATLGSTALNASSGGTGPPALLFGGTATAGGRADITYTYVPVAVPEPASMSLLGIGMAGFFAFRRFFNKRNADV